MNNKNEKWKSLAGELQNQNEEQHIKSLRELLDLSHLLGIYLDAKLNAPGFNRTQRMIILMILSNNAYMTPTEISKITLRSVDTTNKSIDTLEKMGLTRSYRSRKDRRVRRVSLTEKGLEMVEKSLPLRYKAFSDVMSCFTKKEAKAFSTYMQRLIAQINRLMVENAAESG